MATLVVATVEACGYQAEYGGSTPERFHVKLVRSLIPDTVASDEVTAGVREALARAGALDAGDGFPRVEVEVLKGDESSEGIVARGQAPAARATNMGIVARARVVRGPGAAPERDTGDVRADEVITVDTSGSSLQPQAALFHQTDALRAAARRLGQKLAYKVIGLPAVSEDDGLGR